MQWAGDTEPRDPNYVPLLAKLVESLYYQYGKRTLVLFTSRAMLRECLEKLERSGFTERAPLLAQLSYGSRPALIKQFRRRSDGILLGTSSFWEGIDLPGDLLEILVIDKIPFDVPNQPDTEAYNEKIEESNPCFSAKLFILFSFLPATMGLIFCPTNSARKPGRLISYTLT